MPTAVIPDRRTLAISAVTASSSRAEPASGGARIAQTFNQRLRCTELAFFHKRQLPPKELALLCERKPLEVLQIEAPLARAGDPHAINVVATIASFGRCDLLTPGRDLANHRARMITIAQRNGATPQTLRRLD
ncbi:MAG: hypothetical protein ACTHL7_11205, partial [Steroidobacteraceae bacterium]